MRGVALLALASLAACAPTPAATPPATAASLLRAAQAEVLVSGAEHTGAEREMRLVDALEYAAAQRAVERADAQRARAHEAGLPHLTEPQFDGEAGAERVVVLPIPPEVLGAIDARRVLLDHLPARPGDDETRAQWAVDVGLDYLAYGHLDEAAVYLRRVYPARCGKDRNGYIAWKRLLLLSSYRRDLNEVRALAQRWNNASCAFDDAQKTESQVCRGLSPPAPHADEEKLFDRALKAGVDERAALLRQAAIAWEMAFQAEPTGMDAPMAAINGAYAYGQIGEIEKQIDLLERYVAVYGDEAQRAPLKKSDPLNYADHVRYTGYGLAALADALARHGDAAGAGRVLLALASLDGEGDDTRRTAACDAVSTFQSISDPVQESAARRVARKLRAKCPW